VLIRLRAAAGGFIMMRPIPGGFAMCHEWWLRRKFEEREASRRMWDEFERTRPLSNRDVTEEEPEVTLEHPEPVPLTAQD
jgi:hypothetical protein